MNDKLTLIAYTSWYKISPYDDDQSSADGKSLWISRLSYNIVETADQLTGDECLYKVMIDSLIGIFQFYGDFYLSFVLRSELVADVFLDEATLIGKESSKIYMIKTARTVPLVYENPCALTDELKEYVFGGFSSFDSSHGFSSRNSFNSNKSKGGDSPNNQQDVVNLIQNLNHLLSTGYYYSYDTDLTRSLQYLSLNGYLPLRTTSVFTQNQNLDTTMTLIDVSDWNFNWATAMFEKIPRHWLTPIIQGYVGYSLNHQYGTRVEFLMIARRSTLRSGTRFVARGIDDRGNAGNFTETELRVRIGVSGRWKSFSQIRGSLPVYWEQDGMRANPRIISNPTNTLIGFKLHLEVLHSLYGPDSRIIFINLLDVKDSEKLLTEALMEKIHMHGGDDVSLVNYNFHANVKWTNVNQDLTKFVTEELSEYFDEIGYFDNDTALFESGDDVGKIQRGVFRTNCLDSLDRTNAVQSIIAWVWFSRIMDPDGSLNLLTYPRDNDMVFKSFTDFWAEHGDLISIHYSGTPSIYSAHVKQGRSNFNSYLHYIRTSIGRAYSCFFEDSTRQELLDLILGIHTHSKYNPTIAAAPKHTHFDGIKVWCGSWNIAAHELSVRDDWQNWVGVDNIAADIYVFCIQEFILLSPLNVATHKNDSDKETQFICQINEILKRSRVHKYKMVRYITMIGLFLVVYVREPLFDQITDIGTTTVKTGFLGHAGNKGGVGVKFTLNGLLLSFLNVHLSSGRNPNIPRATMLNQIMQNAFQGHNEVASYHHFFVVGGDFNFQIDMDQSFVEEYIRTICHTMMLSHDEFIKARPGSKFFQLFREAEIDFQPTYKYIPGTHFYNYKRTPAWCDRVLYGGSLCNNNKYKITSLYYKRHDNFYSSDHKPVSSILSLTLVDDKSNEVNGDVGPLIDI